MNKILLLATFCAALVIGSIYAATPPSTTMKKVLISQVVDHPALNMTTQGIIDGLDAAGYKLGENLEARVESAQANPAMAAQIANKFIAQNPDVVVGVGTISAQSFVKSAVDNKVNLIFSSVTDPVAAHIVKNLETPGNNTSGVSNLISFKPQLELISKLQPDITTLGIIYNPGEINSVSIVQKLEAACKAFNIVLIKQTVSKTADVAQSAVKLATQVNAIIISNDNTALSSLQSVIRAAQNAHIPVYVSDTDAVQLGAVAAIGPNQYEIGKQAGKMIARVLNGANINTMPVEFPVEIDLYLNLEAAAKAGITIPKHILDSADKIIEKSLS